MATTELGDHASRDTDLVEMLRAMRALITAAERFRARAADRLGLQPVEILALGYIADPTPTTPSDLAAHLGRNASTSTAALDRLEIAGMVTRQQHPTDRRKTLIQLSERGKQTTDGTALLRGPGCPERRTRRARRQHRNLP